MAQTISEYADVTDVAKQIRTALRESFPGVKFSVRCERYSLGESIHVGWTNGPETADVHPILNRFEHVRRDQWGETLNGGNRYVWANRKSSN
jgi:hypothetical protein